MLDRMPKYVDLLKEWYEEEEKEGRESGQNGIKTRS